MLTRKSFAFLGAAVLLAGCQGENGPTIEANLNLVRKSALTAGYVKSFKPFEAAARNLRNNTARYTFQKFTWGFGGSSKSYNSYYLDHSNAEYAHAVGLTGAGQTIAVVDAGFLTTHQEFAGKTITLPSGGLPAVDDHGTGVAAVAAGSATSGSSVGIAPGADLVLGTYGSFTSTRQSTEQAIAAGAIVQNNSWGLVDNNGVEFAATPSNYRNTFGSSAGQAYISSLKKFARNSIIVFAASNDESRTASDMMAGLPNVVSGLKTSWITAINGVPTVKNGRVKSASLLSSGCLDAAAYCMAADGTAKIATASSTSSYALNTGSSFAAPQISGAVALLAEAFPKLSAKEIRARLLASADNSFYKHTGYVKFAKGIKHGYNEKWGHGFLDIKAALLPIGQSFVPVTSGRSVKPGQPVLLSGGMSGDAIGRNLGNHDLLYLDTLGGEFKAPANILTAELRKRRDLGDSLNSLMSVNLDDTLVDPFHTESRFSSLAIGQEMEFELNQTQVAMLVPSDEDPYSYGLAVAQKFDVGSTALSLGVRTMREGDGFVGMKSLLDGERLAANHTAATLDWSVPFGNQNEIMVSGAAGVAVPDGQVSTASLSPVEFNSVRLSYSKRALFGKRDRLTLGVGLPQVVSSGSAEFSLPVSQSRSGVTRYNDVDVSLVPTARQVDLSIGYGFPVNDKSDVVLSAIHSLNSGNVAGFSDSVAAVAWRINF